MDNQVNREAGKNDDTTNQKEQGGQVRDFQSIATRSDLCFHAYRSAYFLGFSLKTLETL